MVIYLDTNFVFIIITNFCQVAVVSATDIIFLCVSVCVCVRVYMCVYVCVFVRAISGIIKRRRTATHTSPWRSGSYHWRLERTGPSALPRSQRAVVCGDQPHHSRLCPSYPKSNAFAIQSKHFASPVLIFREELQSFTVCFDKIQLSKINL